MMVGNSLYALMGVLNSEGGNCYITFAKRHTKLYRLPLRLPLLIKSVPDHVLRCTLPLPYFRGDTKGHHWKIPKERWLLCRKSFTDRCGLALFAAASRFIELVRGESSNGIYCESYACAHIGALRATGVFMLVWPPVERISANSLPASRSKRPLYRTRSGQRFMRRGSSFSRVQLEESHRRWSPPRLN